MKSSPTGSPHPAEIALFQLFTGIRNFEQTIREQTSLSLSEIFLLQHLSLKGASRMKDIAQLFLIKFSTLTSVIDKLEAKNLVIRKKSPQDRRVVLLSATAKGRKVHRDFHGMLRQLIGTWETESDPHTFLRTVEGIEIGLRELGLENR